MKKKSFVLLTIASLISVNSFAFEIVKGHLVSHKEWTTGNAKAIFKTANAKMHQFKNPRRNNDTSQIIITNVGSNIKPQTGKTGVMTPVNGDHYIVIHNESETSTTYTYYLNLCVESINGKMGECAHYFDEIQLEPNGFFMSDVEPELEATFNKAGVYQVTANASLSSPFESTSYYDVSQLTSATNTMTISDS